MDQVKNTADNLGVGPNDRTTVDAAQDYVNKGIETAQNSVFGQSSAAPQQAQDKPKPDSSVRHEVDTANPAAIEEMQREAHRSDPVTDHEKA